MRVGYSTYLHGEAVEDAHVPHHYAAGAFFARLDFELAAIKIELKYKKTLKAISYVDLIGIFHVLI